jgi:hypothetical protein
VESQRSCAFRPWPRLFLTGALTHHLIDGRFLTYTEISPIQDLGEFGDTAEDLTFALVNDDRRHYRKGSVDAGVFSLVLSYDPTAFQAAIDAAEAAE